MEKLAGENSLDSKRKNGGLYNLIYWADLENRIRALAWGLEVGEVSAIAPYNDAFTFIRVEQILPVVEEEYLELKRGIASWVLGQVRQEAWDEFMVEQRNKVKVSEDIGVLMGILADSTQVQSGDFLKDQPDLVFEINGGEGVTGTEMRRSISLKFMNDATSSFAENFDAARQDLINRLVVDKLALEAGYQDKPEVEQRVNKDWEAEMIGAYLLDTVNPHVVLTGAELHEFYDANKESFRGPEEVRLDIMILDDKTKAEEASKQLQGGADFGYVFKQFLPGQEMKSGQSKFIKLTELSDNLKEPLSEMDPGDASDVIEMPMGFLIFKLDAIRPGTIAPFEEVDGEIRRVLYEKKFDMTLEAQMQTLRSASEIQWFPEKIDQFLSPGKAGQ